MCAAGAEGCLVNVCVSVLLVCEWDRNETSHGAKNTPTVGSQADKHS